MSATGFTPILIYASGTATNVPLAANLTSSASGAELALNYADGKLYYKDSGGVVQVLATKSSAISPITNNGVVYINGSGQATTGSALTFTSTAGLTSNGFTASVNDNLLSVDSSFTKSSGSYVYLQGSASGGLVLRGEAASNQYITLYGGAAQYMNFGVAGSEQMRLTSTGLGIGTSSPGCKLDVQNTYATAWSANTSVAQINVLNNSQTANSTALILFSSFYSDATFTGVKAGSVATGSYSADFIVANRNAGTFQENLRLTASGNLGLGVTPSAWGAGNVVTEIASGGTFAGAGPVVNYSANAYYDTAWKYKTTAAASYFRQANGAFSWYTAPSGTAGTAVTFTQAMTLSSTGLAVTGTLSATGKVVAKNSNSLATALEATDTAFGTVAAFRSLDGTKNPYLAVTTDTNGIILESNGSVYGNLRLRTNATNIATLSSTGLAVTGALSATSDVVSGSNFYGPTSGFTLGANNTQARIVMYPTTGVMAFYGTSSEAMRLDASGNLGLGVVPSAWNTYNAMQLPGGSLYGIGGSRRIGLLQNAYYNTGYVYYSTAAAASYQIDDGVHKWNTAPSGTAGAAITFTQAMTLDAIGKLYIGTTTSAGAGQYNLNVYAPTPYTGVGGIGIKIGENTTGGLLCDFTNSGGNRFGSITVATSGTSVAYNTTSDHRLKENVRPANAARFMDIEFVDFEWITGEHACGVIADQLQSVYPDLVLGEKDATEVRTVEITPAVPAVLDEEGNEVTPAVPAVTEEQTFPVYQQVNYTGLIGRMGTRVQQLQRTVDAQAALIAAMEARLSALEAA